MWYKTAITDIACPQEEITMNHTTIALTQSDVGFLRNALATGIANFIVQKVSKNTETAVDKTETKRYLPPTN